MGLKYNTPIQEKNGTCYYKKISLYVYDCGNVVNDLAHEVSKPVDSDVVYVRALCWTSYKKHCVKYKARMIVNPVGKPKLTPAGCDLLCPAGRNGCSCHVMAVIWKLDEMSRNNEMKYQCENDVPCTS